MKVHVITRGKSRTLPSVIVSRLVRGWNIVTVLLHLLHLVSAHVVVQHRVRHHRWRRRAQMLVLVSIPRTVHWLLLVGIRLSVTKVTVLVRLAILHLVLAWVSIQLHHTVVLLVLQHVVFIHRGRHCPRVEQVLLLEEHLHRGRG
jgi:hypothetical protein